MLVTCTRVVSYMHGGFQSCGWRRETVSETSSVCPEHTRFLRRSSLCQCGEGGGGGLRTRRFSIWHLGEARPSGGALPFEWDEAVDKAANKHPDG